MIASVIAKNIFTINDFFLQNLQKCFYNVGFLFPKYIASI